MKYSVCDCIGQKCPEGVQFNWAQFLRDELLINCQEAQEHGKTFHYAWILLSILLVTGDLLKDSKFPTIGKDLPKAARFTLLWATKDAKRVSRIKGVWTVMEEIIQTWINHRPWLSPNVHNSLQSMVEFNMDMYNLHILARKDPAHRWVKLLFIATDDAIFEVMATWSLEWHVPDLNQLEKLAK